MLNRMDHIRAMRVLSFAAWPALTRALTLFAVAMIGLAHHAVFATETSVKGVNKTKAKSKGDEADRRSVTNKAVVWTSGSYAAVKRVLPPSRFSYMDQSSRADDLHEDGMLTHAEREELFHKVGIGAKLNRMDDLDKDLLVGDAREESVKTLRARYPMLSVGDLTRLKNRLKTGKWREK